MKRHTQHKAVLSVIMTAVIGMAGVVTTFAYDSPNTVSGPVDHDVGGDANFIMESARSCHQTIFSQMTVDLFMI